MKNNEPGPLPLVVGVTGHIDLKPDSADAVSASVRGTLRSLKDRFGNSAIWLMSALAEGADQLAAEAALAEGLSLVAILPMPLADYEQTLPTGEGRQRLHALWKKAALRVELPWIGEHGEKASADLQYEQLGLVITHFSHVLLALWNGADSWGSHPSVAGQEDKRGGTAHIVYLRAAGEVESAIFGRSTVFPYVHTRLYPPERGLTFRIASPRTNSDACVGAPGSVWLRTSEQGEVEIDSAAIGASLASGTQAGIRALSDNERDSLRAVEGELKRLDEANGLLVTSMHGSLSSFRQSEHRLLPEQAMSGLQAQSPSALEIRKTQAMADVLSQSNRWRLQWVLAGVIFALLVGVLSYELYVHKIDKMLAIYVAMIAIPAIVHWTVIRPKQWQNHFQDFRALAEALRVQLFWGLAGIHCGVQDYYMRKHQDELTWIRTALRGPALHALAVSMGPIQRKLVTHYWIKNQFEYFNGPGTSGESAGTGKAEDNKTKRERCDLAATIAYTLGACIAVLLLVAELSHCELPEGPHEIAVVLMGFLPALAGALSILSEKKAYKDHAHQYSRMGRIFGKALALVGQLDKDGDKNDAGKNVEFTRIVRDLGVEALAENGDWLISHRDRRVEPIKGG